MNGEWIRKPKGKTSVIFVHGILSSGETCWRNPNGCYWPDLLKQQGSLKACGIYVYTYSTDFFSGNYQLSDVVDGLKEHMRLDCVLDNGRLIFVCHSMGGIVVRKLLVEREADFAERRIHCCLFLVASPSLGSLYATWLTPLAKVLRHSQALALRFARDNAWLNGLDKEFQNLKESQRLPISGKELVEDKFVVLKGFLKNQVVEPISGARYFGEHVKIPKSDHFSIAKPENKSAMQHRLLCKFIEEAAASDKMERESHLRPRTPPQKRNSITAAITRARTTSIEITLDRELAEFGPNEERCLLNAINQLLGISDVRIRQKREGSVKLIFSLTPEQAKRLLVAVKRGRLSEFGVTSAAILEDDHALSGGKASNVPQEQVSEANSELKYVVQKPKNHPLKRDGDMSLDQIDTIIFVMLENRSFDHVLGYLSLPPFNRSDVEGLRPNLSNDYGGAAFPVFHLGNPEADLPGDPPHERRDVGIQLNGPLPGPIGPPPYPMNGFIVSYAGVHQVSPGDQPCVMGYFDGNDLPAAHYFAQQFCLCDHWFCSVPTGTQPNRLMAHSGYSRIEVNQSVVLPKQDLVYDWLDAKKVRWRVYHEGIPFFILMDDWHLRVLGDDHFRDYDDFLNDWMAEGDTTSPQVIFIEPRYTDAPHVEPPSDDHAPSPIANGQRFLSRVFGDIRTNPDRWAKTLLVVTYDEHGGFFDHVSPIAVRSEAPGGRAYPAFESTGPRVPAFLVSPFVEPGRVYHGPLDHTSFLKLLGKKFNGGSYSAVVDARPVGDLTEALTLARPRRIVAPQPRRSRPGTARPVGFTPGSQPRDKIPQAFQDAVTRAVAGRPNDVAKKFPELFKDFGFRR